jgi:hypothetical protein
MKNVLSVRLGEKAMDRLRDRARKEGKELSAVARELINEGLVLASMREYREGKLSLGTLANRLGLSVSEALDALAELGVASPIEYEEYLEGNSTARALMVRDGESYRERARKGLPRSPIKRRPRRKTKDK